MLIAHLPSGYMLGAMSQKRLGVRSKAIMAAALLGSYAPDADMFYFHIMDARRTNHHDFFTHWPLFWLAAGLATAALALNCCRQFLPLVMVFSAGTMLHMGMDTIAAPLHWLAPFSDMTIELVRIPQAHPNWVVSFMLHWTFLLEIAICLVAAAIFIQRKNDLRSNEGTVSADQIAFLEKDA